MAAFHAALKIRGYHIKSATIGENDVGQCLDKFLTKAYYNLSQAMPHKSICKKGIKLNGKRHDVSTRLNAGDILTMCLKDEFSQRKPEEYDFLKAPLKLDTLFESEDTLILDKRPGLIIHSDENYHFDSLTARVQHYLYDKGEYRPQEESSFASALVNWIGRNTDGIVTAAENVGSLRILNKKVKNRELKKLCLCIMCGYMEEKSATLRGFPEKNGNQNRVYISSHGAPGAKNIRMHCRVLGERGAYSLLEIDLLTRRIHQIHVHLTSIGHLSAGGGKYGTSRRSKKTGLPYRALYSYKLRFKFTSPAGILEYLNHHEFEAREI